MILFFSKPVAFSVGYLLHAVPAFSTSYNLYRFIFNLVVDLAVFRRFVIDVFIFLLLFKKKFWQPSDRGDDSCSHSSESEIHDSEQPLDITCRYS